MKNKIREIIWLITAILCFITGIHQTYKQGFQQSWIFFLFAIFAFVLFLVRRNMRNKPTNENNK